MKLYELKFGDTFVLGGDDTVYRVVMSTTDRKGTQSCLRQKDFTIVSFPEDLFVDDCDFCELEELRKENKNLKRLNNEITETWIMDY